MNRLYEWCKHYYDYHVGDLVYLSPSFDLIGLEYYKIYNSSRTVKSVYDYANLEDFYKAMEEVYAIHNSLLYKELE